MPNLAALADELDALASVLSRMPLASLRKPEAPHEARSEIVGRLFQIADRVRKADAEPAGFRRRARKPVPSAKGIHGIYVEGRYVPVVKR
jgi:hypothetical protein